MGLLKGHAEAKAPESLADRVVFASAARGNARKRSLIPTDCEPWVVRPAAEALAEPMVAGGVVLDLAREPIFDRDCDGEAFRRRLLAPECGSPHVRDDDADAAGNYPSAMRQPSLCLALALLGACAAPPAERPLLREAIHVLATQALGAERVNWERLQRKFEARIPASGGMTEERAAIHLAVAELGDPHARYFEPAPGASAERTETAAGAAPGKRAGPVSRSSSELEGSDGTGQGTPSDAA